MTKKIKEDANKEFALTNEGQEFYSEMINPADADDFESRGDKAVDALKAIFPKGTWGYVIEGIEESKAPKAPPQVSSASYDVAKSAYQFVMMGGGKESPAYQTLLARVGDIPAEDAESIIQFLDMYLGERKMQRTDEGSGAPLSAEANKRMQELLKPYEEAEAKDKEAEFEGKDGRAVEDYLSSEQGKKNTREITKILVGAGMYREGKVPDVSKEDQEKIIKDLLERQGINEADLRLDALQAQVAAGLIRWAIQQPKIKEESDKPGAVVNWNQVGEDLLISGLSQAAADQKTHTISGEAVGPAIGLLSWAIKQPEIQQQSGIINVIGIANDIINPVKAKKVKEEPVVQQAPPPQQQAEMAERKIEETTVGEIINAGYIEESPEYQQAVKAKEEASANLNKTHTKLTAQANEMVQDYLDEVVDGVVNIIGSEDVRGERGDNLREVFVPTRGRTGEKKVSIHLTYPTPGYGKDHYSHSLMCRNTLTGYKRAGTIKFEIPENAEPKDVLNVVRTMKPFIEANGPMPSMEVDGLLRQVKWPVEESKMGMDNLSKFAESIRQDSEKIAKTDVKENALGTEIVLSAAEGADEGAIENAIYSLKEYAGKLGFKVTGSSANSVRIQIPPEEMEQATGEIKRIAGALKVSVDQLKESEIAEKTTVVKAPEALSFYPKLFVVHTENEKVIYGDADAADEGAKELSQRDGKTYTVVQEDNPDYIEESKRGAHTHMDDSDIAEAEKFITGIK